MQVIDYALYTDSVARDIQTALEQGEVVIFPTETAYGLICDATNKSAVEKVFDLKSRTATKALPVICGTQDMVEQFFSIAPVYDELIQKYWPGPLSLVLEIRDENIFVNPEKVNDNTVAVRVTSFASLADLSNMLGVPLVATSANISGAKTPYTFADVMAPMTDMVRKSIVYAVDAGDLPKVEPSTLVGLQEGKLHVFRQGPVQVTSNN